MDENNVLNEIESMQSIAKILNKYDDETKVKILKSLSNMLELPIYSEKGNAVQSGNNSPRELNDNSDISPKEYMLLKDPQSDVEKVTCLAYYLSHYRNQDEFKTNDISKLNNEAAQLKFSNAAVPVDNARRAGLLVTTNKGSKKLSIFGEKFVEALPDREKAKEILSNKPKRKNKTSKNKKETQKKEEKKKEIVKKS